MKQEVLEEIGHILKNIAQKRIGIRCLRESVVTMEKAINKDLDEIWEIINKEDKR